LGAVVTVKTVLDVGSQPVFNIKVMQAESFLVGERGMLVHDNSLIQPVLRPFAAMPKLAAANRSNAAASTGR
jgi:hypothetical protein